MDWELFAPMIVSITLILTIGGVAVLRPIALKLSEVLALFAQERHSGIERDVGQIRDLLETMDSRLQLMEDRQDFTDRLLTGGDGAGHSVRPAPGADSDHPALTELPDA